MRNEARSAALLEQMSVRDYIGSHLEDPVAAATFHKHVSLVRESWNKLKPNRLVRVCVCVFI